MKKKRGVSLGTLFMLALTLCVLVGFLLLLPSFTGNQDIRLNAAELAVAMDHSLSQLVVSAGSLNLGSKNTALPPDSLSVSSSFSTEHASQPAPTPTPLPKLRFSLCATGSVIWDSAVRKALTANGEPTYNQLTDAFTGALAADVSLATLENTLIDSAKASDVNQPSAMLTPLRNAGINVLSVGHTSILNGGIAGLVETKQAIQAAGLLPFGVYASEQERSQATLMERQGVRIGLLHFQDDLSATGRKQASAEERAMALSPLSLPEIATEIAALRNAGAQVVVVSLCWGKAGAAQPTDAQRELAQGIADAGGDIIIGTHSGVVQPVQVLSANRGDGRYHPVLCAYSLGNLFTYNRESRFQLAGLLLRADVVYDTATGSLAFENLSYTPTYSWRGKEGNRTLYRILVNDGHTYPEFVNKDQRGVMERCYAHITATMADTGIPMAE